MSWCRFFCLMPWLRSCCPRVLSGPPAAVLQASSTNALPVLTALLRRWLDEVVSALQPDLPLSAECNCCILVATHCLSSLFSPAQVAR